MSLSPKVFGQFRQFPTRLRTIVQIQSRLASGTSGIQGLVKPITVRTCVGIYDQLRESWPHLYRHAPQHGLNITVNYADTALDPKSPSKFDKVIVALHGNYGSYEHFTKVLENYRGTSVRVIAPNLPDFSHTRQTDVFWHSTTEKATFVKDFLRALNINQIDLFLSHSFGLQTAAAIWGEPAPAKEFTTKSVALLMPQSFWHSYDPKFETMKHIFLLRSEPWYRFLEQAKVHQSSYWPMKYANINDFLLNCTLCIDKQSPADLHHRFDYLVRETQIPLSIMTGARDKLIHPESVQAIHKQIGIEENDVIQIDPKVDKPEDVIKPNGRRLNSYSVKNAGHFTHANHPALAHRLIDVMLEQAK